jgi:hypothetical protein
LRVPLVVTQVLLELAELAVTLGAQEILAVLVTPVTQVTMVLVAQAEVRVLLELLVV